MLHNETPSKIDAIDSSREDCRHCRKALRVESMEPLTVRDELQAYGIILLGSALWALIVWAVWP
jgi:hypothetical protein